jgi:hypothetical protein
MELPCQGSLKRGIGPIALISKGMPIVVINAPKGLVGFLVGRLNRKSEGAPHGHD